MINPAPLAVVATVHWRRASWSRFVKRVPSAPPAPIPNRNTASIVEKAYVDDPKTSTSWRVNATSATSPRNPDTAYSTIALRAPGSPATTGRPTRVPATRSATAPAPPESATPHSIVLVLVM